MTLDCRACMLALVQASNLIDRSPVPMVATEGRAHVVRYVNSAFCERVGQSAGAIVGSPLKAPGHAPSDDEADVAAALLDRVYSTGTAEWAVDLAGLFGRPSVVHLPCVVWPILGDDDRPVGLLAQLTALPREAPTRQLDWPTGDELRDVNERLLVAGLEAAVQAEVQITLRGAAEAALTTRDEFISIAAHELRTPVTGIKVCAQLGLRTLEAANPDTERIVRHLLGIVDSANRLGSLVNDLMDVSRMRSGQLLLRLRTIDLAALVSAVAWRYAQTGGERHHVTTDLPAEPLMIAADAGRLEQILDNLLSNALKYSPAGGEVNVSLRQEEEGIVLTVRDAGIGLTHGAQEHIFEPFGRAANATREGLPGMGLGLHICRQIAAAHGGRIWAESDGEGHGTTVVMRLPSVKSA